MIITKILERPEVIAYLEKRQILSQYKKCKGLILSGFFQNISLKIREPKELRIFYFRINKQYRALATIKDDVMRIFEIDDHQ